MSTSSPDQAAQANPLDSTVGALSRIQSSDRIGGWFERRIPGGWLERRIPRAHRITLSQDSIFIFPTLTGFLFGGLVLLLIVGAINYQNSLVYGVAFLLGSLFLVTILYTFRNLSGLSIEFVGAGTGFVGENIEFHVRVSRPEGRGREGIQLGWPGAIPQWAEVYESVASEVRLFVPATRRGWLRPGRLTIETYFPLGLLRAWTWIDLGARALVYPKPAFDASPEESHRSRDEGELIDPRGSDDFNELRAYRLGDSVRRILWRSFARTGDLVVKEYASYLDPRFVLDFARMRGDVEERLSRLTGLALKAERIGRDYGLELPGASIEVGAGDAHRLRVLRALATFGVSDDG